VGVVVGIGAAVGAGAQAASRLRMRMMERMRSVVLMGFLFAGFRRPVAIAGGCCGYTGGFFAVRFRCGGCARNGCAARSEFPGYPEGNAPGLDPAAGGCVMLDVIPIHGASRRCRVFEGLISVSFPGCLTSPIHQ